MTHLITYTKNPVKTNQNKRRWDGAGRSEVEAGWTGVWARDEPRHVSEGGGEVAEEARGC